MARGRSTEIISIIKWIRNSRLQYKTFFLQVQELPHLLVKLNKPKKLAALLEFANQVCRGRVARCSLTNHTGDLAHKKQHPPRTLQKGFV